jgi:hypothetical protein
VVENGKYRTLGENQNSVVFRSRFQHPRSRSTFVAHVRGDPQAALGAIREVTRSLIHACRSRGSKPSIGISRWRSFRREPPGCCSACLEQWRCCWRFPVCSA